MRAIPEIAVEITARYEGLRLKAYLCPAGVPTIGYGHIAGVKMGDVITKEQARIYLRSDMQIAVRKLYGVLKPEAIAKLSEFQWAALLSFAFNLGAKTSWTIWKHINAGKLDLVPAEMMRFTRAGGKVLPGLVNRRADEAKLWSTPSRLEAPEPVPPSNELRQPGMTPPTTDAKPLRKDATMWAGGIGAAGAVAEGARQVQGIIAPQAAYSEYLANVGAIIAGIIVAASVAVLVFRWLEHRKAKS